MTEEACGCRSCLARLDENDGLTAENVSDWIGTGRFPRIGSRMILCATCGNKRCPHANDHNNACTGSNATGQQGSAYP